MLKKYDDSWWSDEDFWDEFGPLMFDEQRWNDASGEVTGILNLSSAEKPARILDVGCGPGRHSLELASRGFSVTGIDIQESYLAEARRISAGVEPRPEFINADMRHYSAPGKYSGAISMFQTIGYSDDPEDDLLLCSSICDSLCKDGWFVLENDGKEATALNFQERTWFERDGRTILLEYAAEGAWDRLLNHWCFRDRDGSWHKYSFSYRLYSAVELGTLLEKSGFTSIEFYGAMDGRPYDQNAERLVALARRS